MAAQPVADTKNQTSQSSNPILVLGPPDVFRHYEKHFHERFQILNPYKSSLPRDEFISTHARFTRAVLCSGVATIDAAVLDLLPALRLIITSSAGLNHIDLPECRRRGISIANASTVSSADVADLAVGLLIDVLRKITAADGFVRNGLWPRNLVYPLGAKLGGKRVGIVGLGSIGLEVAKRLAAFGCIISYFSRNKKSYISFPFYAEIRELASNCDILIISCALTDQTCRLINKEVLLALGKKGVIVNIARGAIIDEKDLIECLQQGEIAGAGLDVFENEPDVSKELFAFDNVVMSPHVAVYTEEGYCDLYKLMCGNLEAFFSNKPLLSPVSDE